MEARAQVTNLGDRGTTGPKQFAIDYASASDAGAHRDIKNIAGAFSSTKAMFCKGGDIAVISQSRGKPQILLHPLYNWESIPAFDMVAFPNCTRNRIDRAAKAKSDSLRPKLLDQRLRCFNDLLEDALRSVAAIDVASNEPRQPWLFAIADAELKLGAANFNAEVHGQDMVD
jgi:hypothetical protein